MVKRFYGFSLIELMVVISIIAVLALVAVPFTQSWLIDTQLRDARSQLYQAHAEAKALGLRNPTNARENGVAACITFSNNTLRVQQPSGNACSGGSIWQASWPDGVTLRNNNTTLTEVRLNNRGQTLVNGNPDNANLALSLSKGSINDTVQLR